MSKVSIIVPTYNVEQYLIQCMDSIINQTLADIEIICVDDGSTDNSGKILDEYALKDNRIKVIHKENGGYGKAMNVGIDSSTGEYIGIVEPDDYVLPDMYQTLYEIAKENDLDFIKSDFNRFIGENNSQELFYNKLDKTNTCYNKVINIQENFLPFTFIINTWNGIYKRSWINQYNIRHNETPGASFQDNGFWLQTFWHSKRAYFLDKPFYMNRRDNPNSSVKNKEKVMAVKVEYDYILDLLMRDKTLYEKFIKVYNYAKYKTYMFNYNRIDDKYKKEWLKLFSDEFKEVSRLNQIDESLYEERDLETLNLIIKNYKKYYRNTLNKLSFIETLFSIKNKESRNNNWYKVITVLGFKAKFRNEALTQKRQLQRLEQKLNDISNIQKQQINKTNDMLKNMEKLLSQINATNVQSFENGDE